VRNRHFLRFIPQTRFVYENAYDENCGYNNNGEKPSSHFVWNFEFIPKVIKE
jgi:hypothetical protein